MGAKSGETSKAHWQKQIDEIQRSINSLKSENVKLRESMKCNNSRTGSKSHGEYCKRMIAQNKDRITNLQSQIKILKAQKANTPKNQRNW